MFVEPRHQAAQTGQASGGLKQAASHFTLATQQFAAALLQAVDVETEQGLVERLVQAAHEDVERVLGERCVGDLGTAGLIEGEQAVLARLAAHR